VPRAISSAQATDIDTRASPALAKPAVTSATITSPSPNPPGPDGHEAEGHDMIAAGRSELRNAHWRHSREDGSPQSKNLLLFYAVESGLKCVYLRRHTLKTTDMISDKRIAGTHDLRVLAKELRLPASLVGDTYFHLHRSEQMTFPIKSAHQAWRYGIEIEKGDEEKLVKHLKNLRQWIQENIGS
jgi:hypothetical protein